MRYDTISWVVEVLHINGAKLSVSYEAIIYTSIRPSIRIEIIQAICEKCGYP